MPSLNLSASFWFILLVSWNHNLFISGLIINFNITHSECKLWEAVDKFVTVTNSGQDLD
jgi:hypothetical protein